MATKQWEQCLAYSSTPPTVSLCCHYQLALKRNWQSDRDHNVHINLGGPLRAGRLEWSQNVPKQVSPLSESGRAVRSAMEIQSHQWFPTVGPPSRHPFTPVDRM